MLGNLLTIPLDGKVLYVEPVYTQAQGGNSFPILRHVIAVYGNGEPAFRPTLTPRPQAGASPTTPADRHARFERFRWSNHSCAVETDRGRAAPRDRCSATVLG